MSRDEVRLMREAFGEADPTLSMNHQLERRERRLSVHKHVPDEIYLSVCVKYIDIYMFGASHCVKCVVKCGIDRQMGYR